MSPNQRNEWDALCGAIRAFALRQYGDEVLSFTISLLRHGQLQLPMASRALAEAVAPVAESPAAKKVVARLVSSATDGEPEHTSDFQRIFWPGLGTFHFSTKRAAVVRRLWEAAFSDDPNVSQGELLRVADSDSGRLSDLFKGDPAWNRLIVGNGRGFYRLAELPESTQKDQPDDVEE